VLAKAKKGAQRIIRLASGESTQRSELDAAHLTKQLRETAVEYLGQAPEEELWLVADCSNLRKPYATDMPYLMQVPALDVKDWCQGIERSMCWASRRDDEAFCIIASLAVRLMALEVAPAEVQEALETVSHTLTPLKASKTITWITDRGFDDVAVWRTIWDQHEHVVCRICHTERTVTVQDQQGNWIQGVLAQARQDHADAWLETLGRDAGHPSHVEPQ
jgi:hypothetical protein